MHLSGWTTLTALGMRAVYLTVAQTTLETMTAATLKMQGLSVTLAASLGQQLRHPHQRLPLPHQRLPLPLQRLPLPHQLPLLPHLHPLHPLSHRWTLPVFRSACSVPPDTEARARSAQPAFPATVAAGTALRYRVSCRCKWKGDGTRWMAAGGARMKQTCSVVPWATPKPLPPQAQDRCLDAVPCHLDAPGWDEPCRMMWTAPELRMT